MIIRKINTLVILIMMTLLLVSCGQKEDSITNYSLKKMSPSEDYKYEWLPLNPTTYKIRGNTIVSDTIGFISEYRNCKIFSIDNWECTHSDDSATFGFRNGNYWVTPEWEGVKHVSGLEYNLYNCKIYMDGEEGPFLGGIACLLNWQ